MGLLNSLGKMSAKTEIAKKNISNKIKDTKENLSEKVNSVKESVKEKASQVKENVSDPKKYIKQKIIEGREEEFLANERRKIEMQLENSNKNKIIQTEVVEPGPQNNNSQNISQEESKEEKKGLGEEERESKEEKQKESRDKKDDKLRKKEEKTLKDSSKEDKKAMDRINDLRQGSKSRDYGFLTILTTLAVVAFILDTNLISILFGDAKAGFLRDSTTFLMPPAHIFVIYAVILIIGNIMVFKEAEDRKNFSIAAFASAIAIPTFILWMQKLFEQEQWIITLLGIAVLFPALPLYLLTKYPPESKAHFFIKLWFVIWLIIGIFFLINNPYVIDQTSHLQGTIVTPVDATATVLKATGASMIKGVNSIQKSFNRMVLQATGQPYEGEEEERRGIFIEKVRAVEKNYYTSSDIFVQANIVSSNLVGEITVKTSCYAKDKGEGTTFPKTLSMIANDQNVIDCHLGKLPKGNYQIYLAATFTYQTDADIQYYFVDEKTRPELYATLNIPSQAVAIYTGGPVELGLPPLAQPLRISASKDNENVGDYPFGVSLVNKWSQGKVVRGISYTLEVPKGIELTDCTRPKAETTLLDDGRTEYVFNVNDNNIKETFDSVTCRMHVTSPEDIFNGDIVAIKTLDSHAVYEYAIEGNTYIVVKDDYFE